MTNESELPVHVHRRNNIICTLLFNVLFGFILIGIRLILNTLDNMSNTKEHGESFNPLNTTQFADMSTDFMQLVPYLIGVFAVITFSIGYAIDRRLRTQESND